MKKKKDFKNPVAYKYFQIFTPFKKRSKLLHFSIVELNKLPHIK